MNPCNCIQERISRWRSLFGAGFLCMLLVALAIPAGAQNDLQELGGPVMQAPTVYLIFWLPSGVHYDPSGAAGDTTYENLMARFFSDVSGSSYLNIVSQYPGVCGPPNLATTQPCFGPVTVGKTFVDTQAYPHTGTAGDPLPDFDIPNRNQQLHRRQRVNPGVGQGVLRFHGREHPGVLHVWG